MNLKTETVNMPEAGSSSGAMHLQPAVLCCQGNASNIWSDYRKITMTEGYQAFYFITSLLSCLPFLIDRQRI